MNVETTRMAPADLTVKQVGSYVVAEEAGGQIAGGLSDVHQCAADRDVTPSEMQARAAYPGLNPCPMGFARTDGHTHLWLGGQTQVVSHAAGRLYVTAPVPTEHPGATS